MRDVGATIARILRSMAMGAISGVLAMCFLALCVWAAYAFLPIPPMFEPLLNMPAKPVFVWGKDPITTRRSFCATRGRQITAYWEIWTTGSALEEPRRVAGPFAINNYIAKGCYKDRHTILQLPPEVTLSPGDYRVRTNIVVHPGHPLERETVEVLPHVPFSVVWR